MQAGEPPSQLIKGRRERLHCHLGCTHRLWSLGSDNPFTGVVATSSDPFRTGGPAGTLEAEKLPSQPGSAGAAWRVAKEPDSGVSGTQLLGDTKSLCLAGELKRTPLTLPPHPPVPQGTVGLQRLIFVSLVLPAKPSVLSSSLVLFLPERQTLTTGPLHSPCMALARMLLPSHALGSLVPLSLLKRQSRIKTTTGQSSWGQRPTWCSSTFV